MNNAAFVQFKIIIQSKCTVQYAFTLTLIIINNLNKITAQFTTVFICV